MSPSPLHSLRPTPRQREAMEFIADYHHSHRNWPSELDIAEFLHLSPELARLMVRRLVDDGLVSRQGRRLILGPSMTPQPRRLGASQKALLERMISATLAEVEESVSADLRYRGRYAYLHLRTDRGAEAIPICRFGWTGEDEMWEFGLPLPGGSYEEGLIRSGRYQGSILEILETLFGNSV